MKSESAVIAYQHHAVNTSLLLAHTARLAALAGSGRGHAIWRVQTRVPQAELSRNKVAVGEPAAGSPPKQHVCYIYRLETEKLLCCPPAFAGFMHSAVQCRCGRVDQRLEAEMIPCISTIWTLTERSGTAFMPPGGWLGSSADEGRTKLR